MNDDQLLRYSRHLLLDGWEPDVQQRLLQSTVLVIGAGGLGNVALMYLAAAGVGTLVVMDPDRIELSNLQRQVAYRDAWVGWPKVEAARRAIADLNPDVRVIALEQRAEARHLGEQVRRADVVVDATDHWASRQLINGVCVSEGRPLVFGAALRDQGQLAVFDVRRDDAPCYACAFPPEAAPQETRCALMGVFAPLTGMVGAAQAGETLKLLTGRGEPMIGRMALIDARSMQWSEMIVPRLPTCSVCSSRGGWV